MLTLNTIRAKRGATSSRKRLGRGSGSGLGGTAGKGHKGQLARSGGAVGPAFEGGQTPLYRRLPKRGFTSLQTLWHRERVLNVSDLEKLTLPTNEISIQSLKAAGQLRGRADRLVILGTGDLSKSYSVKAFRVSTGAQEKITKAGGKVELVDGGN
jgi:large subunit ribosomal protein L15